MPLDGQYAVPDPVTGGWTDPVTGQPSSAPSIQVEPGTNKQVGVTPSIDVGTPTPGAKPGEMGSQYRPIETGPEARPGKAMPAQPVETKPAEAPPPHPAAAAGLVELPDGTWGTQAEADRMGGKAAAAPAPGAQPPPHPAAAAGLVELPDGTWGTQAEAERMAKAPPSQATKPPEAGGAAHVPEAPLGPATQQLLRDHPALAPLVSAASYISGAGQTLAHAGSYGLDEVLLPLATAITRTVTQGVPFHQAYDEEVADLRSNRTAFEAQHPKTGMGLELAGAIGSPLNKLAEPLFAPARIAGTPGARVATKAGDAARNVAAASTVGGLASAGMTEGDLSERLNAVPFGMATGGVMGAAVPAGANLIGRGVQAFRGSANVPRIAGRVFNEQDAAAQFRPAPIADVPLNVAEASGSPEMASLVDKLGAERTAVLKRHRSEQNQALLRALPRTETTAAPEEAAATASSGATKAIKDAKKIVATEGQRLWGKASLNTPNVSTATAKSMVEGVVRGLRDTEPDLAATLEGSARLRQVLSRLYKMPAKASARQINDITSRLRKIGRDFMGEDGDVRHLATRFAKAVDDGLLGAPEVAGRPPVTASDVGAGETGSPPAARPAATAAGPGPAPPRKPQSLVDFLISKGGVKPHSDFADGAEDVHHRQGGKLINPKGMTIHNAREAARDAGFFTGDAANDDRTLIDAVNESVSGRPHFRPEDEAEYQDWRAHQSEANRRAAQAEDYRWQVRQAEMDAGITMTDAEVDHAVRTMMDDPKMHPAEAAEQATRAADEGHLQRNAQAQALNPTGMAGAQQATLPEDQVILRNGAPPNPELVRDLKAARDFTRREHTVLGHASFDNILGRNSRGNETVVPGTAMNRFFDFTNGVEKPGSIDNVAKFLDDIKSEWLKLGGEKRAGTFDPDAIQQVRDELVANTRDFIISKFLGKVSSGDVDLKGDRLLKFMQAARWLETNRPMLEKTGMFEPAQIDLLQRWEQTARMIAAAEERAKPVGSPTFTRFAGKNWADLFMGALPRFALRTGIGGTIGFATGGIVGEEKLGAILGAEGNVGDRIIEWLYATPKAKLTEKLYEAAWNPTIAADLMKPANARTASGFRPETVRWLRSFLSAAPAGQVARPPPAEPEGR